MIKILNPGFYTSIQDLGRYGFQQFGVPNSGALDLKAAVFANALVGNLEKEAVLEMTMVGGIIRFETPTCIAISGANMSPKLNGVNVENNKIIFAKKGDELGLGKALVGFRCYLAVFGGFQTESVMRSKSMCTNITTVDRVSKNDILKIKPYSSINKKNYARLRFDDLYLSAKVIEVYKGPEFECLSDNQKHQLFAMLFSISKNNNRMAYQLNESFHNNLTPIITGPVFAGTIQLTPSGKLIILMRDCQTTGGYPRILQLCESSINTLAQKYSGQIISFNLKE
jgi:biotin-dependent carboxylase-like uncharacterized protein